jgi:AcrR family transcriptional regulator
VTSEGTAFLRARQPEQKQQRYRAILDAARALGRRDGVGAVSLAGIAAEVGMHKSALLRYFGTREEIFLRLAEAEWREWADAVVAALDARPAGDGWDADLEHVAGVLGRSLAERPLLCQLLLHATLTLERNVSLDAVRSFKTATGAALDTVADAVHRALPELDRAACAELLAVGGVVAAGLWQATHPPPVVRELYAEHPPIPGLEHHASLDFGDAMVRFALVHAAGLRRTARR